MGVDYYIRLERGQLRGASEDIVNSVAMALQLDTTEQAYLHNLMGARRRRARPRSRAPQIVPTRLQLILDSISVPAYVENARLDIIAANDLGRAVYWFAELGEFNAARFIFSDDRADDFYLDREAVAANTVALLRSASGRNPLDPALRELIEELHEVSEEFRQLWQGHNVLVFRHGTKHYLHPTVGELEFEYQSFIVEDVPELIMLVYGVAPESRTAEAMQLLASWSGLTGRDSPEKFSGENWQ